MAVLFGVFWRDGETEGILREHKVIRGGEVPTVKWQVRDDYKGTVEGARVKVDSSKKDIEEKE